MGNVIYLAAMDLLKRVIGIILVASVVVVVVVLVVSLVKSRIGEKGQVATVSPSPVASVEVPSTGEQPSPGVVATIKSYNALGVDVKYPTNWSLLTCSNSVNFELDPYGGADSRVACDVALKPVTVLVNSSSAVCRGVETNIGNLVVRRYRAENSRGVDYQWCFSVRGVNFNITHRVSQSGARATSKDDFSGTIEQMIVQWR